MELSDKVFACDISNINDEARMSSLVEIIATSGGCSDCIYSIRFRRKDVKEVQSVIIHHERDTT